MGFILKIKEEDQAYTPCLLVDLGDFLKPRENYFKNPVDALIE